jgi:hypothetical protein
MCVFWIIVMLPDFNLINARMDNAETNCQPHPIKKSPIVSGSPTMRAAAQVVIAHKI